MLLAAQFILGASLYRTEFAAQPLPRGLSQRGTTTTGCAGSTSPTRAARRRSARRRSRCPTAAPPRCRRAAPRACASNPPSAAFEPPPALLVQRTRCALTRVVLQCEGARLRFVNSLRSRHPKSPKQNRYLADHERPQSGAGPDRSSLDRHAVFLHHHPQSRVPLPERPVHHARPRGRRPAALAGLQHGQRQPRGRAGILQHQGAGRPAHLPPATGETGRHRPGRAQTHRHADHRQPAARQAAAAALDRHRARPLRQPDQGPGRLRALRKGRAGARLPAGLRPQLRRATGRRPCARTSCSATCSPASSTTILP